MEVIEIDSDYTQNILDRLINGYIDKDTLANLLEVDSDVIINYKENINDLWNNFDKFNFFMNKILMLEQITLDDPDFKLKAFLDILIEGYKISTKSISCFSKIDEDLILNFLDDKEIPINEKYKLQSSVMSLLITFKDIEPKI